MQLRYWKPVLISFVVLLVSTGWTASTQALAKRNACDGLTDRLSVMAAEEPETHAKLMEKASQLANAEGLLWKIEKPGLEPSWLFGTMHVTDKRITTLAAPVEEAFSAAQHTAFEIATLNGSGGSAKSILKHVFLNGSLRRHLKRADLEDVAYAAQAHNVHPNHIFQVKPLFVILRLGTPTCASKTDAEGHSEDILDMMLEKRAKKEGKSIHGLETLQEHFGFLDNDMKLKDQLRLLVLISRESTNVGDDSETYIAAYQRRNLAPLIVAEGMDEFIPESWSKKDRALFDKFNTELLLTKRNHLMTGRAIPLIEKGLAFLAVGAAHLPGDEGMVELLRAEGYTLTRAW